MSYIHIHMHGSLKKWVDNHQDRETLRPGSHECHNHNHKQHTQTQ